MKKIIILVTVQISTFLGEREENQYGKFTLNDIENKMPNVC